MLYNIVFTYSKIFYIYNVYHNNPYQVINAARNFAKHFILSKLILTTGRSNCTNISRKRSLKPANVRQIVQDTPGGKWHSLSDLSYSTELEIPLE